ncbi:hypothetical protein Ddc_23640 [Ditylenchus destructor]|nr:hypothetical protein Ddc_23640 [Ditylenchus destructor]
MPGLPASVVGFGFAEPAAPRYARRAGHVVSSSSCSASSHELTVFDIDTQADRQCHAVEDGGRAAVAHQRQGQALDADALRIQTREDAVQRHRLTADVEEPARQPEEGEDHDGHAEEAQLLADHGQQEVGVRLGQPVQLLDAAAQAHAEDLAAADGDQRVREDPLAAEIAEGDHQHEGADQHRHAEEEHAAVDAAQEQDADGNGHDHHEGAQLARVHRDGQLGQLRGLEVHDAQRQPAARAVDALAHVGDEHHHQQHQRHDEDLGRVTLPEVHRTITVIQPASSPSRMNRDWRAKKCIGAYFANLGLSGSAIDAEYTISKPSASSDSTTQISVRSKPRRRVG